MLDLLARILFDCTFTYARECECGRSIGFGQDRYLTSISQTFILSFFIIITLMMSDVSEWPTNVSLRNTHTHTHTHMHMFVVIETAVSDTLVINIDIFLLWHMYDDF